MTIMLSVARSQSWFRKRKLLTVLPLLVIPFLTMGFWALEGEGSGIKKNKSQGLNLNLPGPNLKSEGPSDKLSFYDEAAKDSQKLAEEIQNDSGFQKQSDDLFPSSQLNIIAEHTASKYNQSINTSPNNFLERRPEDAILRKLALLEGQLNKPKIEKTDTGGLRTNYTGIDPSLSTNMDKLENMIQSMSSSEAGDPEMNKMGSMLDKILGAPVRL